MYNFEGTPGTGKSHILYYLGKPKWMPKWLYRLRNPYKVVEIRLGNDPDDYYPLPHINKEQDQ